MKIIPELRVGHAPISYSIIQEISVNVVKDIAKRGCLVFPLSNTAADAHYLDCQFDHPAGCFGVKGDAGFNAFVRRYE
jgi:hypothetical protein